MAKLEVEGLAATVNALVEEVNRLEQDVKAALDYAKDHTHTAGAGDTSAGNEPKPAKKSRGLAPKYPV